MPRYEGRLELTWTNKHEQLLAHEDGTYEWLPASDYRVAEVRLLRETESVGDVSERRAGDNLLIRGDALHALKSLSKLPEFSREYVGKVRLCYIDPPFNTEQAFPDYDDNLEHSVWLTMLRDRLMEIYPLLTDDGSVWVHLDDAEVHRCRAVLDEVFGAKNFVATVIWQKAYSPKNDAPALSTDQDYILVYSKNPDWRSNRLPRLASRDALYTTPDGDPHPWVSGDPAAPSAHRNQTWVYAIQSPFTGDLVYPADGRCWGSKQETMKELVEEWGVPYEVREIGDDERRAHICGVSVEDVRKGIGALMVKGDLDEARETVRERYDAGSWPRLYFTRGGRGGLKLKRYLGEISQSRVPQTLWLNDEVGHNRTAKAEIKALFPQLNPFATPKPERLIQRILQIATDPGDIVLDCFAGSGTTPAVAHKMGRRWIAVERSPETIGKFTLPRLTKVVLGEDPGGVSTVKVPAGEDLPEGVFPGQAKAAAKVVSTFLEAGALDDVEGIEAGAAKALVALLRKADKTTTEVLWEGGGGFRVLAVSESMFESDPDGLVYLSDSISNGELAEATAAQLGYEYRSDPPFAGIKGRTRLAVVDGVVNDDVVRLLVSALADDERVLVCGTGIDPQARTLLKDLRPGSTLRKVPAALLQRYRNAQRRERRAGLERRSTEPSQQTTEPEATASSSDPTQTATATGASA
ncbi:site-specific DNA-methyltransferase [Blastococcus sp. TF02A-26]|uniref:site-specific DNA-methyltransferase n=1 Tax=Blastococcus sp. TF02A-26 TaxID=2250577 RepID=UPI000DE8C097|nr:site-specific DNA-methyltransferase [Blastococcus sp. TF02A-26]RBY87441.1 site-specific DNA-methyltransferase [Blastococcus sp. TF02A-26]